MPVNSTHPDYDANLRAWLRARDVIAGEDAVKSAGESYLPRLDSQNDVEYFAYKSRACFFNATGRTWEGFLGMVFRRDPEVKLPNRHAGVGGAVRVFSTDVDLMGTSLFTYSKGVVGEVLAVGRCGSLVDLYASAWTGATADNKAAALAMASRLIDTEYRFAGTRANSAQALQWPRVDCPDPDTGDLVPDDAVPKAVVEAACELARELLIVDRTAAPAGEGLSYQNNGSVQTGYDKTDTRPIIPKLVQALLAKFGSLTKAKSGAVKLVRT